MSQRKSRSRSLGSSIYEGAATWGSIVIGFESIVSLIVALLMFVGGVYLMRQKGNITAQTNATISDDVDCHSKKRKGRVVSGFNCGTVEVEYEIDGESYTQVVPITDSSKRLNKGDSVTIYYDPTNPNDIAVSKDDPQTTGKILIVFSLVIALMTVLNLWLARRYKFVRAASGVGSVFSFFG